MRENDNGRTIIPSTGADRDRAQKRSGKAGGGGKKDGDEDSDDDDLNRKLLNMKLKDDTRGAEVWCTYHGWFPPEGFDWEDSGFSSSEQVYRRCRLAPHWKKPPGCDRCMFHCQKFNADPTTVPSRRGNNRKLRKKKKDLGGKKKKGSKRDDSPDKDDRSGWKFDPVTGRPLKDAL